MSYCRWIGDSDVYVFSYDCQDEYYCEPKGVGILCCACSLNNDESLLCKTKEEMIEHLIEHRKNGERVPQYAIDMLKAEIEAEKVTHESTKGVG